MVEAATALGTAEAVLNGSGVSGRREPAGATLIARLTSNHFGLRDVLRALVGALDTPCCAEVVEEAWLLSAATIGTATGQLAEF